MINQWDACSWWACYKSATNYRQIAGTVWMTLHKSGPSKSMLQVNVFQRWRTSKLVFSLVDNWAYKPKCSWWEHCFTQIIPITKRKKKKNIHPLTLSYTKTCKKEFEFELARVWDYWPLSPHHYNKSNFVHHGTKKKKKWFSNITFYNVPISVCSPLNICHTIHWVAG